MREKRRVFVAARVSPLRRTRLTQLLPHKSAPLSTPLSTVKSHKIADNIPELQNSPFPTSVEV